MSKSLNHPQLLRYATTASVAVALLLVTVKGATWMVTHSVSVLSTFVDSLFDLIASALNFWIVRFALTPADKEHRFGHGKAEALAGMLQAAFISGAAIFVFMEAAVRLVKPEPLHHTAWGISVMILSILLTLGLISFQKIVIAKTKSVAIEADALHYQGDLLINVAVIGGLLLNNIDPIVGCLITLYLLFGAWKILREALTTLMDQELPEKERQKILLIARAHPQVLSAHDLRTRKSGLTYFVQLHLEMQGTMTLQEAHQVTEEVEARIHQIFPNAEVLIHQDPKGIQEKRDPY